ncbi:uncharacterized protein LOC129569316 [Sitodiplosis mosellana]|uniref:uncharacterized protein LOC129569316 n=1 Tax=Sitodiplosis mosellana TaxID=263140 RepID=UPI002443D8E5|nr:uncharacterized protein LOC129569316 [Sitodiplosis mosellana]
MKSIFLLFVAIVLHCDASSYLEEAFEKNEILSDLNIEAPESFLNVVYPGGAELNLGNKLNTSDVQGRPKLTWDIEKDSYYTVVFTLPDTPTRATQTLREFRMWLKMNIPGNDVQKGDEVEEYISALPAQEGLRRFIYFIFKQPDGIIEYDEKYHSKEDVVPRRYTSASKLAKKYGLGRPKFHRNICTFKTNFDCKFQVLTVIFSNYQLKDIMKSIFLLFVAIALNCDASSYLEEAFERNDILSDSKIVAPKYYLNVLYPSGAKVNLGNVLKTSEVQGVPKITWDAEDSCYYALVFYNPDALTRAEPTHREFRDWLVLNIPGNNVEKGDEVEEYIPAVPAKEGLRRYIYLVFKQSNGTIKYDKPYLPKEDKVSRQNTSVSKLAEKYGFGDPVAGNFYLLPA